MTDVTVTFPEVKKVTAQLFALSAAMSALYISPKILSFVRGDAGSGNGNGNSDDGDEVGDDPLLRCRLWLPPPPTVMVRSIRPYTKFIVALGWFYIRFGPSSSANSSSSSSDGGSTSVSTSIRECGLLDQFQDLYSTLSSTVPSYITQYIQSGSASDKSLATYVQPMISRIMLYGNDMLGLAVLSSILRLVQNLQTFSYSEWKENTIQSIFEFAKTHIPMIKDEWKKEEDKMEHDMKQSLWSGRTNVRKVLPKDGLDVDAVINDLQARAETENDKWQKGLVSGAVYGGEPRHTAMLNQVYAAYSLSNPLHPDIWPTVNQCEAEIIAMTAHLLNSSSSKDTDTHTSLSSIVGSTTSGGTESIVMAVRAHLNYYGKKRGIVHPEIICGDTAHAGLDKACEMFGIRLIKIECNEHSNYRIDTTQVYKCMNSNVIMIYASAPSFPQGVIDPIEDLSNIAIRYDVGLHVDACLGGFVLPFAKNLGYSLPKFDFACDGVTSMSADTHKYGYSSKGTSVVLYRHGELRRCQYFSYSKWTGGLYATPTIAGSRAGALVACAWASLVTIGQSGFEARVKLIMDATHEIARGVSNMKGLRLLGGMPEAMVVCFGTEAPSTTTPTTTEYDGHANGSENDDDSNNDLNIYQVAEEMTKKGWSLNSLQNPASVHLCVTLKTVEHKDKFLSDLRHVVDFLLQDTSGGKPQGSAAVYGMAGSLPAGPVNELLKLYTDITLSC